MRPVLAAYFEAQTSEAGCRWASQPPGAVCCGSAPEVPVAPVPSPEPEEEAEEKEGGVASQRVCPPESAEAPSVPLKLRGTAARVPGPAQREHQQREARAAGGGGKESGGERFFLRVQERRGKGAADAGAPSACSNARHMRLTSRR
ncbi:hypothetical protein NDU88_008447 [Pleurodeles waltl]|uniref:Uncharacterized protein n=1 Tax=Pleurodeles waltl TaxID=8319 RepID=A0AAV7QSK0_PLEWA|nr:hypothetical protein NDU88_008447 [Pleurodeles waltl]